MENESKDITLHSIAYYGPLVSLAIFGVSILFKQPLISIVPAVIAFTSLAAVFMGRKNNAK